MLQYRAYLQEELPIVGLHSEGYLLISEAELDSLIEGQSVIRELSSGESVNIYYIHIKMIVRNY